MAIKMLTKLGRRKEEHNEDFHKEFKNMKKNQSELKNTITDIKDTLNVINKRSDIRKNG